MNINLRAGVKKPSEPKVSQRPFNTYLESNIPTDSNIYKYVGLSQEEVYETVVNDVMNDFLGETQSRDTALRMKLAIYDTLYTLISVDVIQAPVQFEFQYTTNNTIVETMEININ